MMEHQYDFGMIGLGVMGRNFLLNVADHGFSAIGMDRQAEAAQALEEEGAGRRIKGTTDPNTFVQHLKRPRRIMLLVPAGKIVDAVINDLQPLLEQGDMIIDGGNSHFPDTNRRFQELRESGLHFLGVGVSGGAEGARLGPSIMPGGNEAAYREVAPILEAVAAKVNGEPCVAFMGVGSAGHYVKMVHNGIEYGLMQLIAETYDLLRRAGGLDNDALHEIFQGWNEGRLQSFLIEITANIFNRADDQGDGRLVDKILDKAKQKGTGKWTSQNAMDLGIPIPTIDAAVTMRGLSSLKSERMVAADLLANNRPTDGSAADREELLRDAEAALYFAFIITYAQGMTLLAEASNEYAYELRLPETAKIWRGGCIIRAALLDDIYQAYTTDPKLSNLLLAPGLRDPLRQGRESMRRIIKLANQHRIPNLALSSALQYFDAYTTDRLPLNLVQAQRDYFGSHTYERTDREGVFHTEW